MLLKYILYLFLLTIVFASGIVRYNKLTVPFKLLTILMGLTLLGETCQYLVASYKKNSMFVEHFTALFEYIFFSLIYYYLLKSSVTKRAVLILLFIVPIFEIINILCFEHLSQFPSNFLNISQFIYLVFSVFLFRQMLIHPSEENIFKQAIFWFNVNILFFTCSMFLNFGLTDYFLKSHLNVMLLYDFSYYVNMLFYLVIGVSLIMSNKLKEDNALLLK